jgi:hypothetical protein
MTTRPSTVAERKTVAVKRSPTREVSELIAVSILSETTVPTGTVTERWPNAGTANAMTMASDSAVIAIPAL